MFADAVQQRARDYSPAELAATAFGFAAMGDWYYDAKLFDCLGAAVAGQLAKFDQEQLAVAQGAFKRVRHGDDKLRIALQVMTESMSISKDNDSGK